MVFFFFKSQKIFAIHSYSRLVQNLKKNHDEKYKEIIKYIIKYRQKKKHD